MTFDLYGPLLKLDMKYSPRRRLVAIVDEKHAVVVVNAGSLPSINILDYLILKIIFIPKGFKDDFSLLINVHNWISTTAISGACHPLLRFVLSDHSLVPGVFLPDIQ
jgi:hypothetical protein